MQLLCSRGISKCIYINNIVFFRKCMVILLDDRRFSLRISKTKGYSSKLLYIEKGEVDMKNADNEEDKKDFLDSSDRTVIKTGSSTYSFTNSWVENDALKDILVGLIVDDLNKQ